MHLTDGQLRAFLDGELGEVEALHLPGCETCQARLASVRARARQTGQRLAFLTEQKFPEGSSQGGLAPVPALARFKTRVNDHKEKNMLTNIFQRRWRPVWVALATLALVLAALSVPQMRAWAGQFLGLFRVQQVVAVPVDLTGLSQLDNNDSLAKQIGQLVSSSINVTKQPGKPVAAASAAEASAMANFTVRLPGNQPDAPYLTVEDGAAFTFTVDRSRAQSLLDAAGRSDLKLPASLDGAKISVEIPSAVTASYGSCPHPDQEISDVRTINGRRFADCIMLAEIPSPTVDAPPDLDLSALVQIGLEFTGMSAEQAAAFSKTVDWTSSLVIPIPKNAATYQTVVVDGVNGTLIQRPMDDAPQYALVWVKNGIIYAIGALGSGSARAIDMANHMP